MNGEFRAQFDADVAFANGGGLRAEGFRLDIPGQTITDEDLAALFVRHLGLLMVAEVRIANTGTYLDTPAHRYADGSDLAGVGLDRLVDLPALVVRLPTGAEALVDAGVALVGIDSVNIDDMSPAAGGTRPAHSTLLAAGVPIVEHLTGLDQLPPDGFRFTAAPPKVAGMGTFPVRAYARID
ncbi:cyclase family protein [Micromonospora craniellae]|uniref:Cyclase family protein n=1 Tax=Micromonospora craniellae TaxID=2294034 RepID=A0A372FT45_9ACTN|nr:hypothetical protein [Micromonospora craniellae]QOC93645.1 hypothetical protein ID554_08425 [Micromonospora craniellae]RFS43967.1 hypothetical protein D0Q02_24645 [Micromonospora craniellae]